MFPAITPGAESQSVVIHIMDSTTGLPEQAVEHNTDGISLWYWRPGSTITAITPAALATLDAAYDSGGIEHIDDGDYRLDIPNAAVAAGVPWVAVGGTLTDMIVVGVIVPLNVATKAEIATQVSTQMTILKNSATRDLFFTMRDSTNHNLATSKTVSGQVNIDGAGFGAVTGAITEVALGWYKLAKNATDRNGDMIMFHFTATGCDPTPILMVTGN